MKALCAVVFVLSSLGAPAQALDASTAYCVDDFFWWTTEQSMIPAQIVAPTIEKLGEAVDETHDVTITGPKDAANVPVGAIQPSDETRTVEDATGKGNKLTVHGTIEQSTIPAQIVATEPAIEKLGEARRRGARRHDYRAQRCSECPGRSNSAQRRNPDRGIRDRERQQTDGARHHRAEQTIPAQIVATEPAIEKTRRRHAPGGWHYDDRA